MLHQCEPERSGQALISLHAWREPPGQGLILDQLDTPIFLLGRERDRQALIYANSAFLRWAGCNMAALREGDWRTLCHIATCDPQLERLQSHLLAGRGGHARVRTRSRNGTSGWAQLYLRPLPSDESGVRFIGQLRDVTAETIERTRLRRQALYDALTGLPNRRLFRTRLRKAILEARAAGAPFALVFLDLDRFKQINDRFGHATADALLRQVARRLRHAVRARDTVARLHGDEFALLLRFAPAGPCAEAIAARVAGWLEQPFALADARLAISCSVGVSLYPDGTDGRALLSNADHAMYQRKHMRRQLVPVART
jgi:diguanylate cyclase (GGDEF)-like protein/PAS domain S-box-containing protein